MIKQSANSLPANHQYNGIDFLKLICAYLVCMTHIAPFGSADFGIDLNFWLQNFLCRIAVPLFFTSSGFLLFRKTDFSLLNTERIKNYCFKILRFLGIWTILLFVGGRGHLWYLTAMVTAVALLTFLIKKKVRASAIFLISLVLFTVGLLGDSYCFVIAPLKNITAARLIINGYETLFSTTRNGVFFGTVFVFLGALFSQKRIVMKSYVAIIGLIISLLFLFSEVWFLRGYSRQEGYNMLVFLLPVVFFAFYIATHLNLKPRPVYESLRVIGTIVFFAHLFVDFFVVILIAAAKKAVGIDLTSFNFILTAGLTTVLAIVVQRLSKKEKTGWIRYIYS